MREQLCEACRLIAGFPLRAAIGIPKSVDILDHIYSLPDSQQEEAMDKIREIERKAMRVQRPQSGLTDLMEYLDSRGVRKGICTRNFEYVPSAIHT